MSGLESKIAIVSGAATGLGLAFANRLADSAAHVLAFDILSEIETAFADRDNVTAMSADVGSREDVEAVVARAASLGDVGVLVNNAGKWRRTPVTQDWGTAVADWDELMDTNLKGVLMLSRAVVPHMVQAGGGHIVNVSTYYVLPAKSAGTNPPDTDVYGASKWALNGFTDAWAKYLDKDNIRVNGLCMGATDSPMLRGLFEDGELPPQLADVVMQPEQIAELMMDVIASGRTGENVGAWVGEPVALGTQPPLHRRITG